MVVVIFGIMGYTGYVYAGRFSVRIIHDGRWPAGSKCYFLSLNEGGSLTIILLVVGLLVS
jgi:hypothetical protein